MVAYDAGMRRFTDARAELIRAAEPGIGAARQLCELTDEAVRELTRTASTLQAERWAVIALGGWGAGALLPASDLDLLILSEQPEAKLKPFVEAVLYPLWDAGLKVGHQVRSPKQQRNAMRDDLKTCTAALTARPLCGDAVWAAAAIDSWLSDVNRRSKRVFALLAERPRPGSPYLLELDLKDGAGGRRDFDELTWRAAIAGGKTACDSRELVLQSILGEEELLLINDSAETIAAARWTLQRDGFGDRMTVEAAAELSSESAEGVQRALASTALVLELVRRRMAGTRGRGATSAQESLSGTDVLTLLDTGLGCRATLELAAQSGSVEEWLPGMRDLMTARRPGLGHELTVGAHCIKAAAMIAEIGDSGPLGRSMASADRRLLQIAALAHDIGKADGGAGHAERGAPLARDIAKRFGADDGEARDIGDIVALHLVLVETALRDDLDDEDAVLRCAARIGRRELLAPLHVLTAVDSMATGPATWSAWTATLVGSLVSRLDAALSDDVDGAGLATRGEASRAAALTVMPVANDSERAFVETASLRYLASRDADRVVRDARLIASLSLAAGVQARIAVSRGPADRTHVVTIAAPDRPQLLARLSGAIALSGLDILSVDAYGAPAGVALDEFVVTSATERAVTEETFSALERFVNAALKDRLELATRLAERRRHYPARAAVATDVRVVSAGWDTVIQVTAADRPGLLHDVAQAVSASGVDIRWAKIKTIDGIAQDVFHVVGPDGGPVDDPGILGHLAMHVREAV